ncbi:MAG: sugar phosphate isomerase/epimerase [Pirellulales bacterium]|nr:sugar phosphate isomerase/epimerase [Pirellulales bacterium]
MKFGINLLLWSDGLTDQLLPVLEQLKELGYDGVELPILDLNPDHFAAWGKRLDDLGLARTGVTLRTANDNPISPDERIRATGIANNKLALECAAAAGCTHLVGPFHSALGEFTGAGPTADEWKCGVAAMQSMAEDAAQHNITLCVEYLNRFECYFLTCAADAARFVDEVNNPACQSMHDTFHAHIEEKSQKEAIHTLGNRISHVHFSANDRATPGTGQIAWDDVFDGLRQINYDGWLMVEAFGLALPALAAATKIWRKMYLSEMQLAKDALRFMKQKVT